MATGAEFDRVASEYHAMRPRYPESIIGSCILASGFDTGARLLEIGSGTGIATEAFAAYDREFSITAIEPGDNLMALAREHLAPRVRSGQVSLVEATFEDALTSGLLDEAYDGILAPTSWRWFCPAGQETRVVPQLHSLLRPAGSLAILHCPLFVSDERGDDFFLASLEIRTKYRLQGEKNLPCPQDIPPRELDTRYFKNRFFGWERQTDRLDGNTYLRLCNTFWEFLELEPSAGEDLTEELRQLINTEFDGSVEMTYAAILQVAARVEKEHA